MAKQVPFHITSGLPYSKTILVTLPNGRDWWELTAEFEVLSQIREGEDETTPLILDLKQYFTVTFDDVDTVRIELSLPGSVTRTITRSGYYDIIMSDPLPTDLRAIKVLDGPVNRTALVTSDTEVL